VYKLTDQLRRHAVGALLTAIVLGAASEALGQPRGKTNMEKVEYRGWKNNLKLANGDAELIVTLDVGPRILSYRLAGGKNVFKEFDDQLGKAGEAEWVVRGGHRLWASPEDLTRTYAPDNGPVAYEASPAGGAVFRPAPETVYGIQKEMGVRLEPKGSRTTVIHRIRNIGQAPTDLAPWALSVMAPGGVELIPMPPRKPHPGSPKNAKSPADFAPDRSMTFWPYFDFRDTRWHFGTNYILLRQDAHKGPTKIGLAHRMGWVGYLNGGTMFVKRISRVEGVHYPDGGVNYETFTNEDMCEMESLGPLVRLAPGAVAEHTETWELISGLPEITGEADVEKAIVPKINAE
jgi:hypothetical protein